MKSICNVCKNKLIDLFHLPSFPVTGLYATEFTGDTLCRDLDFMICEHCGHGQLKEAIDISSIYNNTYTFRTSDSPTASKSIFFLKNYIESLFPNKKLNSILDLGCNDTFLLKNLQNKAERLYGVDLILKGKEEQYNNDKVKVFGKKIEEIDFLADFGEIPDLILSQQTLEHMEDPNALIEKLFSLSSEQTIFIFEFPCLDLLMEGNRYDRIFHQHIQYFSLNSFTELIKKNGGGIIDFKFNQNYWGSLTIAFRKTPANVPIPTSVNNNIVNDCKAGFSFFKTQMSSIGSTINKFKGNIYGYGAAHMLPVLGYYLKTDFSSFNAILDDDQEKDGLSYANLPVEIKFPHDDIPWEESAVYITSLDSVRPIIKELINNNAKHIINPLGIL